MKDAASVDINLQQEDKQTNNKAHCIQIMIFATTLPTPTSHPHKPYFAPPHATFFAATGTTGASTPSAGPVCPGARLGLIGNGLFLSPSRTRCACSVLRMNQPAKRRPTVDS